MVRAPVNGLPGRPVRVGSIGAINSHWASESIWNRDMSPGSQLTRASILRHALAAALGVSQSGISHRLRARVAFTLEELATIAEVFDITLAELLGPVILQTRRSPHTDLVGAGASPRGSASRQLPRLDSNQ
ncbi:helix-turn-helix transcriptional regulator [Micrococcus luteus]|nr:helix-turn-helix transcriptional regulator [Micrococcus luteus]